MTNDIEATPTAPPEGCTCTWSATDRFGSVYIADDDCPARPHPRSWRAEDADSTHLQAERSPRGFLRLPVIPSQYAGVVQVYESSAASGPHVWLRAESPVDLNNPSGPTVEGIAHLTAEDAIRLAEQLLWLVENHYQTKERR